MSDNLYPKTRIFDLTHEFSRLYVFAERTLLINKPVSQIIYESGESTIEDNQGNAYHSRPVWLWCSIINKKEETKDED